MYTVGEFAIISKSTKRTLRYYDEIGILKPSVTLPNGHRLYNEDNLFEISRIQVLKAIGLKLQEISPLHKNEDELTWNRVLEEERASLEKEMEKIKIRLKLNDIMKRLTTIHGSLNWEYSLETLENYFEDMNSPLKVSLQSEFPKCDFGDILTISESTLEIIHDLFQSDFSPSKENIARYNEWLLTLGFRDVNDIERFLSLQLNSKEIVPYLIIPTNKIEFFKNFTISVLENNHANVK